MTMTDTRTQIQDALQFRHACKVFDAGRKIDDGDFHTILEAARLSPSSFGYEPWRFLVIQNTDLRQQLLPVTWGGQRQIPSCSHFVAILARTSGMEPGGSHTLHMMRDILQLPPERMAMREPTYRKFHQQDFHLDTPRQVFDWCCRQTYIALADMMLAAAMLGIDSCPIEGFESDAANHVLAQAGVMNPDEWGLSVMVAFGYRIEAQPVKKRQPATSVIQWL